MKKKVFISDSFEKLRKYVANEEYKGYDPYDTLCSPVPFRSFTSWGPVIATQVQKRNPYNIRKLLRIEKGINPKAMGLFLEAYVVLEESGIGEFTSQCDYFFQWLSENQSTGYKGNSWGYNFPWATTEKYLPAFAPTVVATAFVVRGLFAYHRLTNNPKAKELILGAAEFVRKELARTKFDTGLAISYTPLFPDCCYNASLLGAEVLAYANSIVADKEDEKIIRDAVSFVLAKQHADGHWNYSMDLKTGEERSQIDFHQGYVLDSLLIISRLLKVNDAKWEAAMFNGLNYYKEKQFFPDGRSLWRIPKEYPVEIHNQSQGILTFLNFSHLGDEYTKFSRTIADWTIENMQDESGYFYYRKLKFYTNKISYMRWSNAWMFLALSRWMHRNATFKNNN